MIRSVSCSSYVSWVIFVISSPCFSKAHNIYFIICYNLIKSGLLLSDCVLSRDILSSLEFNCHIVMVFPVLVDCGVEDIDGDVVVILALISTIWYCFWDQ